MIANFLHCLSKLRVLNVASNQLKTLLINDLGNLNELYAFRNKLATINFQGLVKLTKMRLMQNELVKLDITPLKALREAHIFDNKLKTLSLEGLMYLQFLDVRQNPMPDELYDEFQNSGGGKEWEDKFNEAAELIGAIKYRGESLQNLAIELIRYQQDFFQKGTSFVKPMQLGMMAERLQVHRSTISRIVSRKYLECDHGVFPLKFFFQNVIKANDGQIRGVEALQQTILALVATEHSSQPYSDQVLSNILQKRGFDIQRRTVTKYRKMLHIPAAAFRKGVELT